MNLQTSFICGNWKVAWKGIEEIEDFLKFLDCEAEIEGKKKKKNLPAEQLYGENALAHSRESRKKKFCKKKSQMCSLC